MIEVNGCPKISVLMPVFGGEHYVAHAIESVLAQNYSNLELWVVNDGSPDHSADVIRPYLTDVRVNYIEQTNAGVAAARNTALSHSCGDYIALLDQDDLWHPEKLAKQVALMESNPGLGLVHCHAIPINKYGEPLPSDPYYPRLTQPNAFEEIFLGNPIVACCALFRRSALNTDDVFDMNARLRFADEYDLWLRIARQHEVGYVADTLAFYRLHDANNSRNVTPMILATLAVLGKTEREFPDAVAAIPGVLRRGRYAFLHSNLARGYRNQGNYALALVHAASAYLRAPWQCLMRSIPAALIDRFRWYRTCMNLLIGKGH